MSQHKVILRIEKICKEFDDRVEVVGFAIARLELAKALAESEAAQQTYALDGATCPAHGLKLVDGYCPSLTCVYSPPRK